MSIETAGGLGTDWSTVHAHPDGTVSLLAGSMSVGQGLATALSTLVAQRLGLPLSRIAYRQGDTDLLEDGRGNGGSSALIIGGTAVVRAVDDLIEQAAKLASSELEVSTEDLQFSNGEFRVVGTDLSIGLARARARRGSRFAWSPRRAERLRPVLSRDSDVPEWMPCL